MCRQSDRRYEPPNTAEQTGNKRTIRVLRKPDKLISYRHLPLGSAGADELVEHRPLAFDLLLKLHNVSLCNER